eukprot:586588-Amphidinium_carterae.1
MELPKNGQNVTCRPRSFSPGQSVLGACFIDIFLWGSVDGTNFVVGATMGRFNIQQQKDQCTQSLQKAEHRQFKEVLLAAKFRNKK